MEAREYVRFEKLRPARSESRISSTKGNTSFSSVIMRGFEKVSERMKSLKVSDSCFSAVKETAAAFNLFLYMLASHILGACWYLFTIERVDTCWHRFCSKGRYCEPHALYCGVKRTGDYSFLNVSCPLLEPEEIKLPTDFNFGIFLEALQSLAWSCLHCLSETCRFYSQQWRTWAACFIQVAWRHHFQKRLEKSLREEEGRLQGAMAEGGSLTSFAATIYASKFAANALRALRQKHPQSSKESPYLPPQKPSEPDFNTEDKIM